MDNNNQPVIKCGNCKFFNPDGGIRGTCKRLEGDIGAQVQSYMWCVKHENAE